MRKRGKRPHENQQKRAKEIVALLSDEGGGMSVDRLAEHFEVTGMTIRRDLAALERNNMITRTHGGCVLRSPFMPYVKEERFIEKNRKRIAEKKAIARSIAARIPENSSIYLDTGTTATQIARNLSKCPCSVFTNNLCVAFELFGKPGVSTMLFGGLLGSTSPDLYGEDALQCITQYSFDLAILGGDALDVNKGEVYSADMNTAHLSRMAQKRSHRVIIAIDSAKIGKTSLVVVRKLQKNDLLITDAGINPAAKKKIESWGTQVVVISPPPSE